MRRPERFVSGPVFAHNPDGWGHPIPESGVRAQVRVRITRKPLEREIDGVRLDRMIPGSVREVSSTMAAWLIAEGYAVPEMRRGALDESQEFAGVKSPLSHAPDSRRRRSSDR
jgi:hypothetical protein